jgi:hypoxanthine phosphoribosyltransferase
VVARRRVLRDLDDVAFGDVCVDLADIVRDDYKADLVVGIADGGAYVAESMAPHLPGPPAVAIVKSQRPATAMKQRMKVRAVLRRLPPKLAGRLRMLEVSVREHLLRPRPNGSGDHTLWLTVDEDVTSAIRSADRVLVVDDTVDSGRTLTAVTGLVQSLQPDLEIRVAVLASTFRHPRIRPDYCLFERTLLRFPWSLDAAS